MKNLNRKFRRALSIASLGALCCVQSVNINAASDFDLVGMAIFLGLPQRFRKGMFEEFKYEKTKQKQLPNGNICVMSGTEYLYTDDKKAQFFQVVYSDSRFNIKGLTFVMVKDLATQNVYILPNSAELLSLLKKFYSSFPSEWNPSVNPTNERKCWTRTDELITCYKNSVFGKKDVNKDGKKDEKKTVDVDEYGLTRLQRLLLGLAIGGVVSVGAVLAVSKLITSIGQAGGNIIHGNPPQSGAPAVIIKSN